ACRAGEDEAFYARGHGFLQEVQCTGNVGVDELLGRMGRHMGFMEGGRMIDGVDAPERFTDEVAVDDGADAGGKRRVEEVDPEYGSVGGSQRSDHRFTEMACAACDESFH